MEIVTGTISEPPAGEMVETIQSLGQAHSCIIQVFDARYIASRQHLARALELTQRAIETDAMIADDASIELLLYTAATRQIERAIQIGLRDDTTHAVVVIQGSEESEVASEVRAFLDEESWSYPLSPDDLREWFDITEDEESSTSATLSDLVCERVVLLQLEA